MLSHSSKYSQKVSRKGSEPNMKVMKIFNNLDHQHTSCSSIESRNSDDEN